MSEFLIYALAVLMLPVGAIALSLVAERQTKRMIAEARVSDRNASDGKRPYGS